MALTEYYYRFGAPKVIHSDRGPYFDNEVANEWENGIGTKRVFGSPGTAKSRTCNSIREGKFT
jgi:hypothetical protein